MRAARPPLLLASALALVLACAQKDTLDPSVYDQACKTNADCVTVAVGIAEDACCSDCEASAINRTSLSKYQSDLASFCASLAGKCPTGLSCPLAPAVCTSGFCSTNPPCAVLGCSVDGGAD
jgi:hypothetical protein